MVANGIFTTFAKTVSHAAGRPLTFGLACLIIVAWAMSGPIFGYSDTWQLVINTGTTIITFLMVFLIQNTQNRDGAAIQAKLNEILLSIDTSRDGFVGIENLSEEDLAQILDACEKEAAAERKDPTFKDKLLKMHGALKVSKAVLSQK